MIELEKEIKQVLNRYNYENSTRKKTIDDKKIDWHSITLDKEISQNFIIHFIDKLNTVTNVGLQLWLTESTIRILKDKLNWRSISYKQILSESFITEFKDKVDWDNISRHQTLSESFIREFKDKVNWDYICKYQILSEEFSREFKDKVNWFYIYKYQNLILEVNKHYFKEDLKTNELTLIKLLSKTDDNIKYEFYSKIGEDYDLSKKGYWNTYISSFNKHYKIIEIEEI